MKSIVLLLTVTLLSCTEGKIGDGQSKTPQLNKTSTTDSDTIIDNSVVLFVGPSDIEIEELKKEHGEDNFYIIADDANAYDSEALEIVEKKNLKSIFTQKRLLTFTNERHTIDKNTIDKCKWLIIYYEKGKLPITYCPIDFIAAFKDKVEEISISEVDQDSNDFNIKGQWQEKCGTSNYAFFDNINSQMNITGLYSINCKIERESKNGAKYYLKLEEPTALIPNKNLDWNNFSNDSTIAKITMLADNKLLFHWMGFYNVKSRKREALEGGFMNQDGVTTLVKCSDR